MVRRVAGTLAAASVMTANAMLIPPNVQVADITPKLQVVSNEWQAITLPCPDCVLPNPQTETIEDLVGDTPFFIQGGANSLLVNISTLFDGKAIGLPAEYPLYPPLASFNKASVDMIPSDLGLQDIAKADSRRHSVKVSADSMLISEETSTPSGDVLIRIKYHIMSVDNHPVTVDAIDITCVKGANDQMTLISVDGVPSPAAFFDSLPPASHDASRPHKSRPCSLPSFVCQWRDFVEGKMAALSHSIPKHFGGRPGCHGRMGGKGHGKGKGMHKGPKHPWNDDARPHMSEGDDHKADGHRGMMGKPHHRHGAGNWPHHGKHHHQPSRLHAIAHGFMMILVPIVLGASMGIAVGVVGLIVGRLIAFLWISLFRGGRRGYASVRLSEDEAEEGEARCPVHDEPLPVYEDAPAYEEKVAETK
ncbi:hypothetical protein ANO11243_006980 [Dothideomycetidae sp. 11243]|nr:hypothetical protein ANO11243_006980 [fungal sp. No.11243]